MIAVGFVPAIGVPEAVILLVVVLIVIGPGRLPQVGQAIGRGLRELRHGLRDER